MYLNYFESLIITVISSAEMTNTHWFQLFQIKGYAAHSYLY